MAPRQVTRGGPRPGAGRPARSKGQQTQIQVRATVDEKETMREAAARDGETLSAWLRRLGLDKAREQ